MASARRSVTSAAGLLFDEPHCAGATGSGESVRLVQRFVKGIDKLAIWRIAAQLPKHHTAE